ncbi:MAG: DUF1570 domain-containing protein [Planctomycetota bacterium]|nr:DUF1570 domain-containing protein [Planctomycetota bacterium]
MSIRSELTMNQIPRTLALLTLGALLCPPAAAFDKVLLKDGRIIEGKLLESEDAGFVRIRLAGVDIPIHEDLVSKTYVEDLDDYVPQNQKEEQYLKKGWVLFEGRWMSRTRRESELKKRKNADKEIIDKLRREQKWSNAKELETTHFEIMSNCPQEILDDYVDRLEGYYKNFLAHWSIKLAPSLRKEKRKFFLYRNYEDFLSITQQSRGVQGFFNWVLGELHLYHSDSNPEYTIAVLYHEGNHLLTHLIDPKYRYPMWMNEGMAEYYGSAKVDENGEFLVGGLQYGRMAAMRTDAEKGNQIPLMEVLTAEGSQYTARHYAYGWSFVHFLMQTEEYANTFQKFFAKLPKNRDVEVKNNSGATNIAGKEYSIVVTEPDIYSVIESLEKQLGKSVDELEAEWLEFQTQAYDDLTGPAYYHAARLASRSGEVSPESVAAALDYYAKAVALDIQIAECYREYAAMLREGGLSFLQVREPDIPLAWDMIQKAIELDPIEAANYVESGRILLENSPVQNLDQALAMVETAQALAPRDFMVKASIDLLMALIEPARESKRLAEEEAALRAELDERVWIVQPAYTEGEEVPEQISELSTVDVQELIAASVIQSGDWIFQTFRYVDPGTGDLREPEDPWDKEWVLVSTVPDFEEALAAVED